MQRCYLSQVIRRRELSSSFFLSIRVFIFALSPHSGRIIAATNHCVGFTGQEIDVLSFQNNGEPYEGPDDVITPAADRFGGAPGQLNQSQHALGLPLKRRADIFNQTPQSKCCLTHTAPG